MAEDIFINPHAVRNLLQYTDQLNADHALQLQSLQSGLETGQAGDVKGFLSAGLDQNWAALQAGRQAEALIRQVLGDAEVTVQAFEQVDAQAEFAQVTPAPTPVVDDDDVSFDTPAIGAVVLPPPSDPQMRQLAEEIAQIRNKLVQRYMEMREDRFDLYKDPKAEKPGIGSWEGHQKQYEDWQRGLINRLRKWYREDGYIKYPGALPEDASDWSDTPPPTKPAPIAMLPLEQRSGMPPMPVPVPTVPPVLPHPVPQPTPGSNVLPGPVALPPVPPVLPGPEAAPAPTPVPFPGTAPVAQPPYLTTQAGGPSGEDIARVWS